MASSTTMDGPHRDDTSAGVPAEPEPTVAGWPEQISAARAGVTLPQHPLPPRAGDELAPVPAGWRRFLVEPARPARVRDRPDAEWLAVGTVCIGAFMGQLDASIVTVAYPTLHGAFHVGLGAVTWVGLTYLLVLVALVTAVGRVADMIGHKLLYTYGFMVFVAGSALCGLAPSLGFLDAFRAVQAVGAAMLQANSVAIIALALPPERLGRAIGIQGTAQALGLAFGPAVGGLLIALGGWRLIFFVNVPVGVVACLLAWFLIPRSRHLQGVTAFDWGGLGLFVPAVATLLLAVTSLADGRGRISAGVAGLLAGCAVLGGLFLLREWRARDPMLDLRLFRRVAFSAGISSGLLSYLVMFGELYAAAFYLEGGPQQLSPGVTGLELSVMPLAFGVVAPFAGRAADRLGARLPTVVGMLLATASLGALALLHPGGPLLLLPLAGLGAGLGVFTPANNAAIMGAVPRRQAGVASGVLNMTRGMGTAAGQAFAALILSLAVARLAHPAALVSGFGACALWLAAAAMAAACLAALRGSAPRETLPAETR
jgi:EmrB/QacA subfamily drug resistance transporter